MFDAGHGQIGMDIAKKKGAPFQSTSVKNLRRCKNEPHQPIVGPQNNLHPQHHDDPQSFTGNGGARWKPSWVKKSRTSSKGNEDDWEQQPITDGPMTVGIDGKL